MNGPGNLVYKCRRCGQISENAHVPLILEAVSSILITGTTPKSWGPMTESLLGMHSCEDGNIGVSNLIGAEKDVYS